MTKQENKELQELLKTFKKGVRVTKGYKALYCNGISNEDVHSNSDKNSGEKVGAVKVYEVPQYYISKDGEHLFSIEAYEGSIIVMGDSNSEVVTTWSEAFEIGLDFFKNGY